MILSFISDTGVGGSPPMNATSFVGIDGALHGTGLASPSIPTHLAPTGTQKDAILGLLVNSVSTTAPTAPAGWTALTASASSTMCFRWIWKWAATNAETFGTPADATRAVVWVYRFTVAPAVPFIEAPIDKTNPTNNPKGSGTGGNTVRHTGHTLVQSSAHLLFATAAKANVSVTNRTGAASTAVLGATTSKVMYGRSNGAVAEWLQQNGATDGPTETMSSVLELAA